MDFQPWQIAIGSLAAVIVGFSKTGVPGTGILMVPMMAAAFGGWLSIGATLPLLIFADVFAVLFYRAHAQWDRIRVVLPYVFLGVVIGTWFLRLLGDTKDAMRLLNQIIGGIVLAMLSLSLLRSRLGDRLHPTSRVGVVATGVLAGFTTMTSNAAGPIMQIYLVFTEMPKHQLMGTTAWFFFIVNIGKLPFLIGLTLANLQHPMMTRESLLFDAAMIPLVLLGALGGRAALPHIPQRAFSNAVLLLALVGGLKLILLP